ncbi:MAG: dockerin type I domain-containing protein [Bacteroidota bacterium]
MPILVLAYPGIPHQFYGTVKFADNVSALDGTTVEAKIGSAVIVSVSTKDGKYGYNPNLFYVVDPDNNRSGSEIQFFVNGLDSESVATFSNGKIENLNLLLANVSTGILNNPAGTVITSEQVVVVPGTPTVMNVGSGLSVSLSPSGTEGTSAMIDKIEKLGSSFFSGATAIMAGDTLLNGYEIKITGDNLTITVTMSYDDSLVDESTIKPYRFDGTTWVALPFTIDKVANTITFTISSAQTPYSVFGETLTETSPPSPGGGGGGGGGGGITTPSTTTGTVVGDVNGNGKVDKYDFALMMSDWGKTGTGLASDLNGDGKVDKYDFSLLMVNWSIS